MRTANGILGLAAALILVFFASPATAAGPTTFKAKVSKGRLSGTITFVLAADGKSGTVSYSLTPKGGKERTGTAAVGGPGGFGGGAFRVVKPGVTIRADGIKPGAEQLTGSLSVVAAGMKFETKLFFER